MRGAVEVLGHALRHGRVMFRAVVGCQQNRAVLGIHAVDIGKRYGLKPRQVTQKVELPQRLL